jgi:hypothetical protein
MCVHPADVNRAFYGEKALPADILAGEHQGLPSLEEFNSYLTKLTETSYIRTTTEEMRRIRLRIVELDRQIALLKRVSARIA